MGGVGSGAGGGVNLDTLWGDRARFLDEVPHFPGEILEGRTVSEAPRRQRVPAER
jgi:hypothetical protein